MISLYGGPKHGSKLGLANLRDRIDRCAYPVPHSGCWIWIGAIGVDGYGRMRVNGKTRQAHIVVYAEYRGSVPSGMELDHKCRVRCCVNPDHLEPVTHLENVRRGDWPRVAREPRNKTDKCRNGHIYDLLNTRFVDGKRTCRACNRVAARRSRLRSLALTVAKLEGDDGEDR